MSEEIVLQGGKEEEKGGIHVAGVDQKDVREGGGRKGDGIDVAGVDQEGVKEGGEGGCEGGGGEGGCRDNRELNWRSMLMF